MNKPKKTVEIKLSKEDVMRAIELLVNDGKYYNDINCINIKKTKSTNWFLIAEIE